MAPSLKDTAKKNLTTIADPVSLERGKKDSAKDGGQDGGHKTLKQIAEGTNETNPSMLGDPVSMKAETSDSEPTENDRGAGVAHPTGKPKL